MILNQKRRGFTLIELLAVIIVITLIAAFILPKISKNLGKSKVGIASAKMSKIGSAIESFYIDCDRYPETLEDLQVAPGDLEEKWGGSYLKNSEMEDPWGNRYIYVLEGQRNRGSYDLICLGADGQPDGEGDNADIFND